MNFYKSQLLFRECKEYEDYIFWMLLKEHGHELDKIIIPFLMFISVSNSILIVKLRVSFVLL